MKRGETLFGFAVTRVQAISELNATLYELTYQKNGARLVFLDRADENMTFAIAFKTPPTDDTGVFHIIEHSVLCGSERYPVKDPFVVLLKSSLQTFLNALTFPDKTVYPVSSRNRQDFLNLMDVYLDAVLHPLSAKNPHAFLQEGWHYALSEEGELTRNGVVYNEMKGAFANPDRVLGSALERALYPDTCYGFVSGGDPAHIPELTYEGYLAQYRRCYHPSNAYIFLDGAIDLDAVLAKLDGYLGEFSAIETGTEIPMQPPVLPPQTVVRYGISPEEAEQDKVLLAEGYVYGTYADIETQLAVDILTDVLSGTNDAPLKKAFLEQGLCEDVEVDNAAELQQPYVSITMRNTSEEKAEPCRQALRSALEALCTQGLDHSQLHAAIDHLEFATREKDSGRTPIGLIFGINILEQWLYGGDGAAKLELEGTFAALRRSVDAGGFEQLLRRIFLENNHRASVLLLPDAQLLQRQQQTEQAKLDALKKSWSEAQALAVRQQFETMRRTQQTPDTVEQLNKVPRLSLQDLPAQLSYCGAEQSEFAGHRLIFTPKDTGGISYLTLHFALPDFTLEELSAADFISSLLGELATERYTPTQLFTQIQATAGHLSCRPAVYSPNGKDDCTPYFEVSLAVLEEKKTAALALLEQMLCHSVFDDAKTVRQVLQQLCVDTEQDMIAAGNSYALQHAVAGLTAGGAVGDACDGIGSLRWLQRTRERFDKKPSEVCQALSELCRRIFIRERITLSLTGKPDDKWLQQTIDTFPTGNIGEQTAVRAADIKSTGYLIPAQIGFAAKALDLGGTAEGSARVAAKLLSLDHLWNEVRVKGGAYGVGFGVRLSGIAMFSTYRDPNPCGALASFSDAGAALRRFCDTEQGLDDYIISSISDLQPLLSPRAEGARNTAQALEGITAQMLQAQYAQVLHTTKADLRAFSERLDKAQENGIVCVVGGEAALDTCKPLLEHRELLQGTPVAV